MAPSSSPRPGRIICCIWSIRRDKEGNETLVNSNTSQPISDAELEESVFKDPPIASGEDMVGESCKAEVSPTGNNYIAFEFDPTKPGAAKFEETTRAYQDHYLAVFLDKKLITAPTRAFDWKMHPIFGHVSEAAWLRWAYLHMDHHLRQFGV